jgi:outer membrane protein assembly factor BamB
MNLSSWCLIACLTLSCGSGYEFVTDLHTTEYDRSVIDEQCRYVSGLPGYQSALRDGVFYATPGWILSAFDLQKRSYLWRLQDPEFCVREFVLVEDQIIVVQTKQPPQSERIRYRNGWRLDYFVAALDANSGAVLWRTELPSDVIGLAVHGDSIYLAGHSLWSEVKRLQSQMKRSERRAWIEIPQLHAVDLETGSIRWSRPLQPYHEKDDQISRATLMPVEAGVLVHKNSLRRRRDAEFFDSSTGERRWAISVMPRPEKRKPQTPSWLGLGPVENGRFAVFRGKTMDVYSLQTGEKIDSIEGEWLEHYSEMRFKDQTMYQYRRGFLRAFDLATGKTVWVRELGIEVGVKGITKGHCPMDIRGGVISIGADDGFIYLVNTEDGSIRGRTGYGMHHRSSPAFIFGDEVIVHDPGRIVSMRPHNFWERMNPFL